MGNVTGNTISLTEVCKLIDVYKRMSIDGERVDLITYPIENNKRVIIFRLQDGKIVNETSYLFDDGDEFDNNIYPIILSYFLSGDLLGSWKIVTNLDEDLIKGVNETQTGNVIYLSTYDENYFDNIKDKIERKGNPETSEDKVWDEILQYAKNKRMMSLISLKEDELDTIYNFLLNYVNDDKFRYGNTRSIRTSNEEYLNEVFSNKEVLLDNGISETTINKINSSMIKQFARLLENEKRIRYRIDTEDRSVSERISFAIYELAGVGYFEQKNKITHQMPTIKCKMGVISKLLSSLNMTNIYTESLRDKYKGYCYEIVGYLYRKGMDSKTKEEYDSIMFNEYSLRDEEKNTSDLSLSEINEIVDFVEEEKNKAIGKDREKELFRIVKPKPEKVDSDEVLEIKDAYEKSLNYSTDSYPAWIKILFEKDNKDEADVIILNKSGSKDLVLYQRPMSLDKLKDEIMEVLRELFTKNNSIHYNVKYKLDDTESACLLMVGDKRTTFSIINGPIDFIDDNKRKLEELME